VLPLFQLIVLEVLAIFVKESALLPRGALLYNDWGNHQMIKERISKITFSVLPYRWFHSLKTKLIAVLAQGERDVAGYIEARLLKAGLKVTRQQVSEGRDNIIAEIRIG